MPVFYNPNLLDGTDDALEELTMDKVNLLFYGVTRTVKTITFNDTTVKCLQTEKKKSTKIRPSILALDQCIGRICQYCLEKGYY